MFKTKNEQLFTTTCARFIHLFVNSIKMSIDIKRSFRCVGTIRTVIHPYWFDPKKEWESITKRRCLFKSKKIACAPFRSNDFYLAEKKRENKTKRTLNVSMAVSIVAATLFNRVNCLLFIVQKQRPTFSSLFSHIARTDIFFCFIWANRLTVCFFVPRLKHTDLFTFARSWVFWFERTFWMFFFRNKKLNRINHLLLMLLKLFFWLSIVFFAVIVNKRIELL